MTSSNINARRIGLAFALALALFTARVSLAANDSVHEPAAPPVLVQKISLPSDVIWSANVTNQARPEMLPSESKIPMRIDALLRREMQLGSDADSGYLKLRISRRAGRIASMMVEYRLNF